MKFFVQFFIIFLPSVACNLLRDEGTSLERDHSSLFYVAGIINDWNQKYSGSNLVVVLDIGNKSDSAVDLLKVIPKENSVLVVDPKQCRKLEKRKAAFVIISSDIYDAVKLHDIFAKCVDEPFWISQSTKFFFLSKKFLKPTEIYQIFWFFESTRRLNVAYVFKGNSTQIFAFDTLQRSMIEINGTVNVDTVFSDKLRDLRGYKITVSGGVQFPRIKKKRGKLYGNEIYFVNVLLKLQNATCVPLFVNYSNQKTYGEFQELWSSSKIDLNLNTMNSGGTQANTQKYYKSFNTYDVIGYCALIPIPPSRLAFVYVFGPFDWMTWLCMVISLTALMVVWCIFKTQHGGHNLNSPGYMVLRVIAGFFGQAISFRHSRWFHLMVIQIFIFMMMILGSVYQSQLISEFTTKLNGTRITTIDEMLKSDSKYVTDAIFYNTILTHHQKLREKFNFSMIIHITDDFRSESAKNFVLVMRCDVAEEIMTTNTLIFPKGNPSEFYYILPEKFFSFYETLSTSRFSPFVERFEELSLKVFESGIRQHWKILMRNGKNENHLNEGLNSNENEYLAMQELKLLFLIWGVGLCVAFITFIAELLCHKYREQMKNSWIGRAMRKISQEEKRQKRRQEQIIMMRRMQRLRPIIEEETLEMILTDV